MVEGKKKSQTGVLSERLDINTLFARSVQGKKVYSSHVVYKPIIEIDMKRIYINVFNMC